MTSKEERPEGHRMCPWWLGYLLVSPLRRLFDDPSRVIGPFVRQGMTVLEPGPGMGFYTLEIAERVGPNGRVVAVDVQPKMLAALRKRAARAGLLDRIETREAKPDSLGVDDLAGKVELVVLFAMVHEVPDPARLFEEVGRVMSPAGKVLLAEPAGHVSASAFETTLVLAERAGFRREQRPGFGRMHRAVLVR